MIETHAFESAEQAQAFLQTLGGYAEPPAVAPLKGEAAHEVAVGPVHAGVIEPGHFRFQCVGENVYNLQIFLGYQHRGVEDAIVQADGNLPRQIALAETCAGDTSIAAATAFAEIIEARDGLRVSARDHALRRLLLELERIANHVGDLGALAGDVAFLPTASFCGRIRGDYLNLTALVCGNRFGRNAVMPGGLRVALTDETRTKILAGLRAAKRDLDAALKLMFESPSVCDRLDGTGVVPKDVAAQLGLVGVARRASDELNGDVLARALIRRKEIDEAHEVVFGLLEEESLWAKDNGQRTMDSGEGPHTANASRDEPRSENSGWAGAASAAPFTAVVATVAAWRGPLVHAAVFDTHGAMRRYKIVDPSAHNWQGLAWALRGEQISNFPICNKSFNLSYCGTDR